MRPKCNYSVRNLSCRRDSFSTFSSTLGLYQLSLPLTDRSYLLPWPQPHNHFSGAALHHLLPGCPWRLQAHLPVPSPTRPVDTPHGSQSDHVTAQRVPSALHSPRMTHAPLVDKALLSLFSIISHCSLTRSRPVP